MFTTIKMEMKTGIKPLQEVTKEQNAFILSFLAIIFRRVWITAKIYSLHQNHPIDANMFLKCLKYNVLAETGIGNLLKPFLVKALTEGFLMPNDYKGNVYAERAVKLFGEAYKICTKHNHSKDEELNFIHGYASSALIDMQNALLDNRKEALDLMADVTTVPNPSYDNLSDDLENLSLSEKKHHCELCHLIDLWDLKMELIYSEDPYNNVIITGLLRALENSNI